MTLSLLCSYCKGTQNLGDRVLQFSDSAIAGALPAYIDTPVLDGTGTSCRSIQISFAGNKQVQEGKATAYLKVVQQKSPVVQGVAKAGTITTINVTLDGGPVVIRASASGGNPTQVDEVLMDITGSCYTADGRP